MADCFFSCVIGILFLPVKAVVDKLATGSFDQDFGAVEFSLSAVVLNFTCPLFKLRKHDQQETETALQLMRMEVKERP